MSEHEKTPKLMMGFTDNVTMMANGKTEISSTIFHTDNVSTDEVREAAATAYGISPDEVHVGDANGEPGENVRNQRSRGMSVGFLASRWNSPWNPGEDKSHLN